MKIEIDVEKMGAGPIPSKAQAKALIDSVRGFQEVPAWLEGRCWTVDELAGFAYEQKLSPSKIPAWAMATRKKDVQDKEKIWKNHEAQPKTPAGKVYDPSDVNALTVEGARAELDRILNPGAQDGHDNAYWNRSGRFDDAAHSRAMAHANRLREIINGDETSLTGYVEAWAQGRENGYQENNGPRESKHSSNVEETEQEEESQ